MSESPKIIGKECRFAIYIPPASRGGKDYHLVKEAVHYDDGTVKPALSFKEDYKRSLWVTKKPYQNHEQKKEYEYMDRLIRHESTQSQLQRNVARALGIGWSNADIGKLSESPYLYGTDISSTSLIKNDYIKAAPDLGSDYSVAYFDIETDVLSEKEEGLEDNRDPILITTVFENRVLCVAHRPFFKGYADIERRLNEACKKYIQEYIDKYKLVIEFKIVDTVPELITESFKRIHEWKPDFLAIWNLGFDIPRILSTLEKYNIQAKDVFSDPCIPPELRFCKFKKGSTKKVTASGQVKPKAPSEQWHSLLCPASFYVICAMASYRFIRQGEQELAYYGLDFILNLELGLRKLRFSEADHLVPGSLPEHEFLQQEYPVEYTIYNIFDCIGMKELEEKNDDLRQKLPIQCGVSDFSRFNSQTKRFADEYFLFLLDEGKVVGTVAPRKKDEVAEEGIDTTEAPEEDSDEDEGGYGVPGDMEEQMEVITKDCIMSLRGWILTLPSHLSSLGLRLVLESNAIITMIRCFVYDCDAVAAYPTATAIANVSRETTKKEIIEILGVDEQVFRIQNMNILHGHINALEYCNVMHKLPTPQDSLKYFQDF